MNLRSIFFYTNIGLEYLSLTFTLHLSYILRWQQKEATNAFPDTIKAQAHALHDRVKAEMENCLQFLHGQYRATHLSAPSCPRKVWSILHNVNMASIFYGIWITQSGAILFFIQAGVLRKKFGVQNECVDTNSIVDTTEKKKNPFLPTDFEK